MSWNWKEYTGKWPNGGKTQKKRKEAEKKEIRKENDMTHTHRGTGCAYSELVGQIYEQSRRQTSNVWRSNPNDVMTRAVMCKYGGWVNLRNFRYHIKAIDQQPTAACLHALAVHHLMTIGILFYARGDLQQLRLGRYIPRQYRANLKNTSCVVLS